MLAWLIEYAGVLQNLFGVGQDGLTPYQRVKGKSWKVPLPAFGECIEYRKRTTHKLESRWERGLYLGIKEGTIEKLVGAPNVVYSVSSIRRVPEDSRYDGDLVRNLKGVPWKPNPKMKKSPSCQSQ